MAVLLSAEGRQFEPTAQAIRNWWEGMGKSRYPEARELFITADAGGSNGYRSRTWKHELQRFADEDERRDGCTVATSQRIPRRLEL